MSEVLARPAPHAASGRSTVVDGRVRHTTLSVHVIGGLCRIMDVGLMALAAVLNMVSLKPIDDGLRFGDLVVVSVIAIATTYGAFKRQNLYSLDVMLDPASQFGRFAGGIVAGGLASAGALALLNAQASDMKCILLQTLAWCVASGTGILSARSLAAWRLQHHARHDRLTRKFAVVGVTAAGVSFLEHASSNPALRAVGVYDDCGGIGRTYPTLPVPGSLDDLLAYAKDKPLDAIVIALPLDAPERIAAVQRRLAGLPVDIVVATDLAYPASHVVAFGESAVVSLVSHPLRDWRGLQKAAFDRATSAVLLLLFLPLMSVIAFAVKVTSPGPVLFRQAREGLNGNPFVMFKFRTMVYDHAADQSVQATRRDPRVTRFGYWLRRTSLDELPQLFNVLIGDMSLVGPRPHFASTRAGTRLFHDVVPGYAARHRVKPGLTGWAQVQGLRGETRTEQQIADRVAQDLYYIDNWSIGFDLRILLQTLIQAVCGPSDNAY